MITLEICTDKEHIEDDVRNQRLDPIVTSPDFTFPCTHGCSSDTSTSFPCGWDVHAFGFLAKERWSACTCEMIENRQISINPLKLLASAAAVLRFNITGGKGTRQKIALQGDDTLACLAANTGVAYIPAMRLTLGIFFNVCQKYNTR